MATRHRCPGDAEWTDQRIQATDPARGTAAVAGWSEPMVECTTTTSTHTTFIRQRWVADTDPPGHSSPAGELVGLTRPAVRRVFQNWLAGVRRGIGDHPLLEQQVMSLGWLAPPSSRWRRHRSGTRPGGADQCLRRLWAAGRRHFAVLAAVAAAAAVFPTPVHLAGAPSCNGCAIDTVKTVLVGYSQGAEPWPRQLSR